jgi:acylphosphatase
MMREIECIVKGRVQMVMYRDWTARTARKTGILGTVENMDDGSVRVVAQAEESRLADFIAKLKKGSPFSRVKDVSVVWKEPSARYNGFTIVYRDFLDRF